MNKPTPTKWIRFALLIWMMVFVITLGTRVFGPSDLGQNLDQSKTIAFTFDVVQNGNWALPRDSMGNLTRKPPLINWIGAPVIALGFHSQLALKLPAVLSAITISIIIFLAARTIFRKLKNETLDSADQAIGLYATPLAIFASSVWLASPTAIKQMYFMRPDILFTALLISGWFFSIKLLDLSQSKHTNLLAFLIWLCATLAAITKGPLALLIPIYLIVHILILIPSDQRAKAIMRTRWYWGVPLFFSIPLAWLYAAYQADAGHVRHALFGEELGNRVAAEGTTGFFYEIARASVRNPSLFFERFMPWSVPAILAILFKPSSRLRTHPLAPVSLWFITVILTITLFSLTAGSYIMPAHPAAAILATYVIFRLVASTSASRAIFALRFIPVCMLLIAILISTREATMSRGATNRSGDHLISFANVAESYVSSDQILFKDMHDSPLALLMGRYQPGEIQHTNDHRWIIAPTSSMPSVDPIILSAPVVTHDPVTGEPIDTTIRIGLYPFNDPKDP